MKKILLSTVVAAMSVFGATAEEPLYTLAFGPDLNSKAVSGYLATTTFSVTDNGLTFDMSAFNNNGNGGGTSNTSNNQTAWEFVRCGRKNNASVATITTSTAVSDGLTKVVVNAKKNKSGQNDGITSAKLLVADDAKFTDAVSFDFTSDVTALTSSNADITIEIATSATNKYYRLVFDMPSNTNNGWLQINNVKFYGEAAAPAAVATPVIEMVEGGEGYVVKMSCATEGAEIRYTQDGSAPTATSTLYTAPIECFFAATYKAIAIKDGELSNVATFDANPPYVLDGFDNLFDFVEMMEPNQTVPVVVKGNISVLYQSPTKQYTILHAGNKNMLAYNMNQALNPGDTFNRLDAEFTVFKGLPELTGVKISEVTAGEPATPAEYFVDQVAQNALFDFCVIKDVAISQIEGKKAVLTDIDELTCTLYNQFGIEGIAEGTGYDITGFVGKYNAEMQFWPIEIENKNAPVTVAAPTFNPVSGSTIPLYAEIEITAEEGAEIYYMIEGLDDEFWPYEGPEMALEVGTMTIKAYAKKGDAVSETVTATYTVSKPMPGLAWINAAGEPVTEVIYVIDGTPEQQLLPEPTGQMMGEPTLTSSNPEVASVNDMMGLDIHKVGETVITLAVEETSMYAAEEASFTLKVISKADAQNISATVDFSNSVNEVEYTSTANKKAWEATNGTFVFNTVGAVGEGGNTYPKVMSGQLRLYGSSANTITVAAPTGYKLKEVSFVVDQNGQEWLPTVDGTVCTKEEVATQATTINCGTSLATAADQIVIGCGGATKHIRINSITFVLTEAASGIEGVDVEAIDAKAEYYNLQGVRVENPAAGLYIRRQGNKVTKVIIR